MPLLCTYYNAVLGIAVTFLRLVSGNYENTSISYIIGICICYLRMATEICKMLFSDVRTFSPLILFMVIVHLNVHANVFRNERNIAGTNPVSSPVKSELC